jgi:RNA polymerase sigma-70 factor (ECF subfamily)
MDAVLSLDILVLRHQGNLSRPENVTEKVRRQWASGDRRGAYALAVASTQDSLYRFLVGLLRNEDDAREIFQDTYVRVYQGLDGFRGEASITTWVLRIGRNLAWNRHRRTKTRQTYETSLEASNADKAAPDVPYHGDLQRALARLPESQHEAVFLFYMEGFSVDEVAGITGRPANTVKSDLLRARTHLRAQLEGGAIHESR